MISERLSMLLRHGLILAGFFGFVLGIGLGLLHWSENTLLRIVLNSLLLSFAFAALTRFIMMRIFGAYLQHLVERKEDERKAEAQAKAPAGAR